MNTHADKSQENKSQSVANGLSQKQSSGVSPFRFVDNRPEAIAQRKLQEIVNNSPQAKQTAQLQATADNNSVGQKQPILKKENKTGLPDNLKTGIENLSGLSLDDVKVHRNSDKPAQLQAHAYAQGTDIHLGPGQEKHLPHETWHVVQQKQGRVKPTMQMKGGVDVNDDKGLEQEADALGAKALQMKPKENKSRTVANSVSQKKNNGRHGFGFVDNQSGRTHQLSHDGLTMTNTSNSTPIQRVIGAELEVKGALVYDLTKLKLAQGTVIGEIPQKSGIKTEIHAESPRKAKGKNGKDLGVVTMEYATGKYNTVGSENISQMPEDAQNLTEETKAIKKGATDHFNYKDFSVQYLEDTEASIQINVSPNKGKTEPLANFLEKGPTLNLPGKKEQRGHAINVVPSGLGYRAISNALKARSEKYVSKDLTEAKKDRAFFAEIIPTLVIHISGLISYNYRILADSLGNTHKNAFEAMPRFDLWQLILNKLRETYGKESSLDDEGFKPFIRPANSLVFMMEVLKGEVKEIVEKSVSSDEYKNAYKNKKLNSDLIKSIPSRVEESTIKQIVQLIKAKAILVPSRPDPILPSFPTDDGDTILHGTDTTKIPLSPGKSPEGAYEIRAPFVERVPIDHWAKALKQYETRLYGDGVLYLIGQ